jgi:hypothetical protein
MTPQMNVWNHMPVNMLGWYRRVTIVCGTGSSPTCGGRTRARRFPRPLDPTRSTHTYNTRAAWHNLTQRRRRRARATRGARTHHRRLPQQRHDRLVVRRLPRGRTGPHVRLDLGRQVLRTRRGALAP